MALKVARRCSYCGTLAEASPTAGGANFNRDLHIAQCGEAPSRERQQAKRRLHWSGLDLDEE